MGRALRRSIPPARPAAPVSIHARPLGRALPNSRQYCAPGDVVSIHARPLGRAFLVTDPSSYPATLSFNPRPPFGTGASEDDDD
ncbi:protein of unknown function [Trichlorobacter ammonificans]|uniref:Uncharacterized protein n=1 Tax=Trichlorobacter ammonificans TaxID=2916410 RepID=A0ABM9D8A3_9BACT|nr:protein of unknown function [Trichlorobacter ammonificans]